MASVVPAWDGGLKVARAMADGRRMRSFLICLVGALLGFALPAQARHVTLELEAGGVVEGRVVSIDSKALVVEVDGEERTFATEAVRKYRFFDAPVAAVDGEAAAAEPAATPMRAAPADPEAMPAAAVVSRPATARSLRRGTWEARLDALDRAYPWLYPAEPSQWISLGVMLFALLSLAVHFGARLAATENLNFGRATAVGLWLLLTGIGQFAVLPATAPALAGAVAGNLVVLTILFAITYGLSFGGSLLATFLFLVQGGIGFSLLQLVDATLRSIGNTTF